MTVKLNGSKNGA